MEGTENVEGVEGVEGAEGGDGVEGGEGDGHVPTPAPTPLLVQQVSKLPQLLAGGYYGNYLLGVRRVFDI